MQIIDLATIQAAVTPEAAFDAVRASMVTLAAGGVNAPDEFAMHMESGGEIHIKGAHLRSSPWIAMKVAAGGFPEAPNAGCTLLVNATTGAPAVILDDNGWLTEMRTAAAGAIATDTLANVGPLRVAVLGSGIQARFQIEALRARRPVESLTIWSRNGKNAEALAGTVDATVAASVDEAVANVDAVITCTSARSPILHSVPEGTHITAMGSDVVGKRELGEAVLDAAAVIAADEVEICARVGELQHAPGRVDAAVNLYDVVAGTATGRQSRQAITVADLCGIGTYDAAIAGLVAAQLL